MAADFLNAVGNDNRRERFAVLEGIVTDRLYALGNDNISARTGVLDEMPLFVDIEYAPDLFVELPLCYNINSQFFCLLLFLCVGVRIIHDQIICLDRHRADQVTAFFCNKCF